VPLQSLNFGFYESIPTASVGCFSWRRRSCPKIWQLCEEKLLKFFWLEVLWLQRGRSTGRTPTEENEGSEDKDEESGKRYLFVFFISFC
jgi:hypothetical protein